jgi:hypothetical protein
MKYALTIAFAVVLAATAACGGGGYQAPPAGNGYKAGNTPVTTTTPGKTQPTGESRTREFNDSAAKAQAAWKDFARDKSADNYAVCGAHIYNALRFRIEHERNGHDAGTLRGLRELNQLKKDWTATEGQLTTEQKTAYIEHADYKAAKAAYNEVQQ